jgi:hypothetical protein
MSISNKQAEKSRQSAENRGIVQVQSCRSQRSRDHSTRQLVSQMASVPGYCLIAVLSPGSSVTLLDVAVSVTD